MIAEEYQAPPHLEKTEKAVLSVLLQRRPGWDEHEVIEDLFYVQSHKAIFRLLKKHDSEMDLEQLGEIGVKEGVLDKLGGGSQLCEIFGYAPTAVQFGKDVETLRLMSARRMAIMTATRIIDSASTIQDETFLEHLGKPITDIIERATNTATEKPTSELLMDVLEEYKEILEGKKQAQGWSVSLPTLTAALRGFCRNRVIVVSGYPSSGKTLLVGQFLIDLAKQGVPSMMMSFEMPRDQIAKRLVVTNGRFDPELLYDPIRNAERHGNQYPRNEDKMRIANSFKQIKGSPLHIEEATAPTVDQVIAMIRRAHRKHGIIAFGIDYLQLMRAPGAGSKEQELTEISHRLQAIMKELGLIIFLLSQQNKEGGTKYASTTQEDADYRLSIKQQMDETRDDFKKVTGLLIDKDRHTGRSGFTIPIEKAEDSLYFKETQIQHQ